MLEAEIRDLKNPTLMYRRPKGEDYEKFTDVLDDLLIRLEGIEESLR